MTDAVGRRLRHAARALMLSLALPAGAAATAAGFSDDIAQRMRACTVCHGEQGRAAPDGYHPRIAGKPAGYLLNQLHNFREGRRHYRLMSQLLAPLSDAYLAEIAGYFAAIDLPYPPPPASRASPQQQARGEQLVLRGDPARALPACADCHGERLTGILPAAPGLLGLPRDYLVAQLGAWRSGTRRAHAPDCMRQIALRLAPDDVAAVSDWLASRPVPVPATPAAASASRPPPGLDCGGSDSLRVSSSGSTR